MRNVPVRILSAVDTSTQTGAAIFVGQAVSATFIPTFGDAAAAGTVKIQGSNDSPVGAPSTFTPVNWADIPSATSTIASGAGPMFTIQTLCFQYIRAVYTRVSGGSTTVVVDMSVLSV